MVPTLTFVYDRKGQATRNKPAVVELRVTANGKRKYISTGIKLLPKEWSNGSVVGRKDWKELNDQLQTIKRKCSEVITELIDEGNLDVGAIPNLLHDKMVRQNTFLEYCKEQAERKKKMLAEGTAKHYLSFFTFLETWKGIVLFSDITESNISKMDDVLTKRGLKVGSIWNYHKLLKMFITKAVNDGLIRQNPYTRMKISKGDNEGLARCLEPDEFHRFENCEIKDKRLERVRDLFIFQTYTMMGYADLKAFRKENCVKVGDSITYKARRTKTHQNFTVVLLRPALEVLEKYNGVLPIISNPKYNEYLKEAVRSADIDKPVTSHWARHTGATMLLNEGKVPLHVIQHVLGHASIRETERTYARLMDNTIVEAMSNYGCSL